LFPSFGLEKAETLSPIKKLMEAMRASGRATLDSIDAQLLLRELYDSDYAIGYHNNPQRPLSLVGLQPKETVGPYTRERRLYHRYATLKIHELFGLSIERFLAQPREKVEWMLEIAEERGAVENRNNQQIETAMRLAQQGAPRL